MEIFTAVSSAKTLEFHKAGYILAVVQKFQEAHSLGNAHDAVSRTNHCLQSEMP